MRIYVLRAYVLWYLLFTSCRQKTASASVKAPSISENGGHTKQPGDVPHTSMKEDGGSQERSGSVKTEGMHGSTSVTPSVEGNREPSSNGAASNDNLGAECKDHCPRVQGEVEAMHTVKAMDSQSGKLLPDSTLKPPQPQNDQLKNGISACSVAESNDSPRKGDDKAPACPLPSQEEIVGEPCSSDAMRTSSTENTDASVGQAPSTPVCPDGNAVSRVPVKSVDPDNSEDGIYRVFTLYIHSTRMYMHVHTSQYSVIHMAKHVCIFHFQIREIL